MSQVADLHLQIQKLSAAETDFDIHNDFFFWSVGMIAEWIFASNPRDWIFLLFQKTVQQSFQGGIACIRITTVHCFKYQIVGKW